MVLTYNPIQPLEGQYGSVATPAVPPRPAPKGSARLFHSSASFLVPLALLGLGLFLARLFGTDPLGRPRRW